MKFICIYHEGLDLWIQVPSIYLNLVQKYCVTVSLKTIGGWDSYYSYLMTDDSFLRLPDSFVTLRSVTVKTGKLTVSIN